MEPTRKELSLYPLWRDRLVENGQDAKKTIAIARTYPTRSAAIVISKLTFRPVERCRKKRRKTVTKGTMDSRALSVDFHLHSATAFYTGQQQSNAFREVGCW